MSEATESTRQDNYVRVNVTKNSRGYNTDKTISFTWSGDPDIGRERLAILSDIGDDQVAEEIRKLEAGETA